MFEQPEFGRYLLGRLIMACGGVFVSALIAFLAATAVRRFRFSFRTTLLIMFLDFRSSSYAYPDDSSPASAER